MTVSEYIFDFLHEKGVGIVYMVSGSSAMWLTDALCRNKDMTAVCCHHEQAAAMAADGYARSLSGDHWSGGNQCYYRCCAGIS